MKAFAWLNSVKWLAILVVASLAVATVASADNGPNHKTRQGRPISLGTSGGNINHFEKAFCYGGTLGGLVQDSEDKYILSNNHVLARTNKASIGDDVVQPGLIDVGCQKLVVDAVADLSAFKPIQFKSRRSTPLNTVDAAIAKVRAGAVNTSGDILDIGTPSNLTAQDKVGCAVQKSGRTTGNTKGTISAVDVTMDVNYGGGKVARFVDQFLVTPGSFSAGGDSGSEILRDGASPRAVGLLFAGSPDYTVANPIAAVQAAFGVTMVGSGDGTGDCPDDPVVESSAATAAKRRNENALLNLPSVAGVGVGVGGNIEVYLANENAQTRARIPAQVDGVPVRVIVTGEFQAR